MKIFLFIISLFITILSSTQIFACTGFFATQGDVALVGNNEDYFNTTQTKIVVQPPESRKYGRLFFGFGTSTPHYGFGNFNPQGGVNEQGLFFDCFATPPLAVTASASKPKFKEHPFEVVLAECATVEDVIAKFNNHNLDFMKTFQLFIADKTGQSAIIEGDKIIRKSGRYQVVTNFHQSKRYFWKHPCKRYKTAIKILERSQDVSIEQFKKILEKTHVENIKYKGGIVETLYSNIYDLRKGLIYVYYHHDFSNEIVITLNNEFVKGKRSYDLKSLFTK
jgi:penicillin V acylase-like amidase (Ntn superfamily)